MKTKDIISDKLSKIEESIREFEEETGILISHINRRYDFFSSVPLLMENKVEFVNRDMIKINSGWPPFEKTKEIPKTHTT